MDQDYQNTASRDTKTRKVVIIVPAHNEATNLRNFYSMVNKEVRALKNYVWEFIFVDDGSKDNTWRIIEEMSREEFSIRGICLSRNFGKEIALQRCL